MLNLQYCSMNLMSDMVSTNNMVSDMVSDMVSVNDIKFVLSGNPSTAGGTGEIKGYRGNFEKKTKKHQCW